MMTGKKLVPSPQVTPACSHSKTETTFVVPRALAVAAHVRSVTQALSSALGQRALFRDAPAWWGGELGG